MMDDKITENILGSHSEETPLDTNESKEKEEYEIKLVKRNSWSYLINILFT